MILLHSYSRLKMRFMTVQTLVHDRLKAAVQLMLIFILMANAKVLKSKLETAKVNQVRLDMGASKSVKARCLGKVTIVTKVVHIF